MAYAFEHIQAGYGIAKGMDSYAAGRKAVQSALKGISDHQPSAVIVFSSVCFNLEKLLAGIHDVVGNLTVFGTTTAGEIYNETYNESVVVVILASPYIRVRTGIGRNVSDGWLKAVKEAVSQPEIQPYFSDNNNDLWSGITRQGKSIFSLFFSPGNTKHSDAYSYEILEELKRLSGNRFPFFGGSSADDWKMETNYIFHGRKAFADSLLVVIIETSLRVGMSMGHGFLPSDQQAVVTHVRGHEILELQGKEAATVYAQMIGSSKENLYGKHLTQTSGQPVGIRDMFDQYRIAVASYFTPEGGVRFSQPVHKNTNIAIMQADPKKLIEAGRETLRKAIVRGQISQPVIALVFSCALRQQILKGDLPKEIFSMKTLLPELPIIGFYSFGEQGLTDAGVSCHGNEMISVLVIGDELTASAEVSFENRKLLLAQKQNEMFLNAIVENIPDMIFVKDAQNLKFVRLNKAGEDLLGYSREEMLGKNDYDFFPSNEADFFIKKDKKVLESKTVLEIPEETVKTRYKGERVLNTVKIPLMDEKGNPEYLLGISEDITNRKQAEEALRNSESFLNTLLNSIPIPVFYKDTDGRYLGFNKAFEDYFGLTRNELTGKTAFDINPPELAATVHAKDKELLQMGGPQQYESQVRNAKGDTLDVIFNKAIFRDQRGNVNGLIGAILDITERKRSEIEREKLQIKLLQSQKMESIGNLAGGIAHDFNNILTSIIGFTELTMDEVERGTAIADDLQEVYNASKRARDLVKQILAFARQSEEELMPIQPGPIVKEVLKFIRSTIPTSIEIKQAIESESLIMGNATQIHQILMNLCTNAAHAMQDKGGVLEVSITDKAADSIIRIEKSISTIEDYIEIKVSDTGVGIDPSIIDAIFEPYFTTKNPGEGTGMGLAMVQGIVETYGGQITVESRLGEGTTFLLYLPIAHKRKHVHRKDPIKLPTGKERVLFVDDEAPLARWGEKTLSRLGYSITVRTSSVEALELFRSKPNDFDLVITDMTMPNMSGDQLAMEIMNIRKDIPVILCTGYSKKISEEKASEIGIMAFTYKPIVKADLAKTVRKVLDAAKMESSA